MKYDLPQIPEDFDVYVPLLDEEFDDFDVAVAIDSPVLPPLGQPRETPLHV